MRIDLLYGIYSSLFVALFVNTTWNAISDQILLSSHLSWNNESGERKPVGNEDAQWSLRLDQSDPSSSIKNSHLVNTNNGILNHQSSFGRRVQVFYRGLKQSSASIFSYNNTIPAILDVFWDDSGPVSETPALEEIQYSIKSVVDPITVPSSTLPALGDKLRYSWAYNQATFAMVTPPGFDEVWDFTGLTSDENLTEEYLSPNQGVYAYRFPGANLMTKNAAGEESYFVVSASGLRLIGFTENTLFGQPFTVVYDFTRIGNIPNGGLNERFTPLNFFDTYGQSAGVLEGFRFNELPPALQNAYLAAGLTTTDSVRLRHAYSNVHAVDAFGTLTIPGQNAVYPVLRMKTTQYRECRIDGKVNPLGWLDITDLTMQYFPASIASLGVDTTGSHKFFNDVTKEEIALITLDAEGARTMYVLRITNHPVSIPIWSTLHSMVIP